MYAVDMCAADMHAADIRAADMCAADNNGGMQVTVHYSQGRLYYHCNHGSIITASIDFHLEPKPTATKKR